MIIPAIIRAANATEKVGYHSSQKVKSDVVINISIQNCTITHRIVRRMYALFVRSGAKKNRPKTAPDKNSITVICGINGPEGARKQLSKSPIAAVSPARTGPNKAPVTYTEINFSGIFTTVPIRKVQKIESRAVIAISRPSTQRFFTVKDGKIFFKKSPFL